VLPTMRKRGQGSCAGRPAIRSMPSASSDCALCRKAWPRPIPRTACTSCISDWTAISTCP
jgi:hypothetical protein